MRERGNIWPLVSVAAGALLVLVIVPLIIERNRSGRMATVDAQVSITTLGVPYTQNFDTLIASGSATWTNNSTIPGWFHARTGTGTTIVASDGATITGNLYSF